MSEDKDWEYSFTWRILDFPFYNLKNGEELKGPTFSIEVQKNTKWYLSIYPGGINEDSKDYVSCFLTKSEDNEFKEVSVISYKIEMILDGNCLCSVTNSDKVFRNGDGKGDQKFYERDDLLTEMEKRTDDILTLQCFIKRKAEIKRFISKYEGRTLILADKSCFAWKVKFVENMFVKDNRCFCLNDTFYKITLAILQNDVTINIKKVCESSSTFQISGKISLLDTFLNESVNKKDTHDFDIRSDIWEFPSFITKKQLLDNANNGTVNLFCTFFINNTFESQKTLNSNRFTYSDAECLSDLSFDCQNMYTSKRNSDVKLRANNGIEFKVHRCVLATRSPVFSAMFDQEMVENLTGIINIEDVDSNILESFLKFLYTGVVGNMDTEIVTKLLLVANKYQVHSLKQKCVLFLMSNLSVDNVFEILSLADMVNHELLKALALEYAAEHVAVVFTSLEFKSWAKANPDLSIELMAYVGENVRFSRKLS